MPREYMMKTMLSEFCEEWRFPEGSEKTRIRCFHVYPGIVLKLNSVYVPEIDIPKEKNYSRLKINCCIGGRCEVPITDRHFVYLEPGRINFDLRQPSHGCIFPGGYYQGLELVMDLPVLNRQPPAALTEFGIDVPQEAQRLAAENGSRIFSAGDGLKQSCSRIHAALSDDGSLPELPDCRYFVSDMLYQALRCPAGSTDRTRYVPVRQRRIAIAAQKYLLEHEDHPLPVRALAAQLGVSATALETCFQAVYGVTVHAYLQNRKIEKARELLEHTSLPVSGIAEKAGYSHPGKFAAAFKKQTGMTPLEYRRRLVRSC